MVPTYTAPSDIAGTGVFASQHIPAGAVVWRFDHRCDDVMTVAEFRSLKPLLQRRTEHFDYYDQRTGMWVISGDDTCYVNHSPNPNLIADYSDSNPFGAEIAARDIKAGEELTDDYRSYDRVWEKKLGGSVAAEAAE